MLNLSYKNIGFKNKYIYLHRILMLFPVSSFLFKYLCCHCLSSFLENEYMEYICIFRRC